MRNAQELRLAAWEALVKALGPADAIRYRALYEPGTGDYASERDALFRHVSLDDWIEAARLRAAKREP